MNVSGQIRFIRIGYDVEVRQVFIFPDAYPSYMLKSFVNFFTWLNGFKVPAPSDPGYVLANFIYYSKLNMEGMGKGDERFGYSVENAGGIYGDEKYLWLLVWRDADLINPAVYVAWVGDLPADKAFKSAKWHYCGRALDPEYIDDYGFQGKYSYASIINIIKREKLCPR